MKIKQPTENLFGLPNETFMSMSREERQQLFASQETTRQEAQKIRTEGARRAEIMRVPNPHRRALDKIVKEGAPSGLDGKQIHARRLKAFGNLADEWDVESKKQKAREKFVGSDEYKNSQSDIEMAHKYTSENDVEQLVRAHTFLESGMVREANEITSAVIDRQLERSAKKVDEAVTLADQTRGKAHEVINELRERRGEAPLEDSNAC